MNRRALSRSPELEAAVQRSPWDEARWDALEAFLVTQRDPRCELIDALRSGTAGDIALAVGRLEKLLFGKVPRSFHTALDVRRREWRAGFLRACSLRVARGGRDASLLLSALGDAVATALLRELTLHPTGGYVVAATLLAGIAHAPFTPHLRRLRVEGERGVLPSALFAPFARLELLDVGQCLPLGRLSPDLTSLRCTYPSHDEARTLFAPGAFPRLTSLRLVAPFGLGQSSAGFTGLDALYDGTAAPLLREVVIERADEGAVAHLSGVATVVARRFE